MDALKNIINNVPDWVQQLDKMGDEIDQRQAQLAALCIANSSRSLRNKGSTESLKLKDEDDEVDATPAPAPALAPAPLAGVTGDEADQSRAAVRTPDEKKATHPSSPSSETPSALQKQTKHSFAKAQAHARAVVKKRVRTESVMSDEEGGPSKYRSKTQVEVFYDEFVEKFFDDLVKFVSASRNLMRKAKMTAKVAHIRRMAELEGSEEGDEDDSGDLKADTSLNAGPTSEALPSLRYMSTRRMGPRSGHSYSRAGQAGGMDDTLDAYDELDEYLEYVQETGEHAAHQFLRDGQCRAEIANIQRVLVDTKELAAKEMERVEREEPELLKAVGESNKVRTLRPTSMRRELTPAKDNNPPITPRKSEGDAPLEAGTKTPATQTVEVDMSKPLEADDTPIEADDEGIDDMEISLPPRLNYRSTRVMRGPQRR